MRRSSSHDSLASDSTAKLAVASKKQPPPESLESIRIRCLVVASFWAIVIFLGLPTWWWTTSIHRARLPLREMLEWADGKACKPAFPLQIFIDAPSLQETEAEHLVRITQHALDDLNEFSAHHLRLRLGKNSMPLNLTMTPTPFTNDAGSTGNYRDELALLRKEAALTVRLLSHENTATFKAELQVHSTVLDVYYGPGHVPSISSSSSALANFIAIKLQDLFAEEQATVAYILSPSNSPTSNHHSSTGLGQSIHTSQISSSSPRELRSGSSRASATELANRLASRMTRSLKYAPTYHLTISLFTPTASPSDWDIDSALAESLAPLLESLSGISNFTVDTQVQLYATFSPSVQSPEYDSGLEIWTLREEDLSGFINAAEWPLSPSIGAGPTLNFVIYVPDPGNVPLVVKGSQASSWLIPQWGGVFILNSPRGASDESARLAGLSKEEIQPALLTFSHQLLSFLGAPQSPPSLPLQLQTLTRLRAASLLFSASSTMGSLARLTVALPSIAIPETVSTAVDITLAQLRRTCGALKDGRFNDALSHARVAEAEAENGFFEKSMVGQVYFPDEHKVAVYLPLLGPVGVPLVMSALKELKRLWTSFKTT